MSLTKTSLEHLTDSDWALLRKHAQHRTFKSDEIILRQDDMHLALYVVQTGFVRVERGEQGSGIAISLLGPGEIFGEMSFLEGTGASASVVAAEHVVVDVIDGSAVQALLGSDPGLSARFYRSIARSLSARLRRASRDLAVLRISDVPGAGQRPVIRTGHIQERLIPPALRGAVAEFQDRTHDAASGLAKRAIDEGMAQHNVSSACDALVEMLARLTDHEALVAATMEDPFSFRDPGELSAGIGAYVFREGFSIFMSSATIARCYTKPSGYPDDWETLMRIHRDEPEGEGRLGALVDRWFLSRPLCRTIRASRDWMASLLVSATDEAGSARPVNVTSLSGKAGSELLDAMAARPGAFRATILDGDPAALQRGAQFARRLGVESAVSFVNTNVVRVAAGESKIALPQQQIVYALGLFEYLDDAQLVQVLDWSYEALAPGGIFIGTNAAKPGADRALAEHILEWQMTYRSDADLRDLLGRSRFGVASGAGLEIAADEDRGTWFLRCVRSQSR